MISNTVILILSAALINADLKVHINTCCDVENKNITQVKFQGYHTKPITDFEINNFNVTEENLKRGAKKYIGKTPDLIFLKNPTPWGDIFKKYKCKEVYTIIKVVKTKVLKFEKEQVTLVTYDIFNNSTKPKVFDTGILHKVKNSVKTKWKEGKFNEYKDIKIHFNITIGQSKLVISNKWGEDQIKEFNVEFDARNGDKRTLKPQEGFRSKLMASRGEMRVKVYYEVRLGGVVINNYRRKYGKHYYWSVPTEDLMVYAGLEPVLKAKQEVEIEFYCNHALVLEDNNIDHCNDISQQTIRRSADESI